MPQAVAPGPVGIGLFENLPAAGVVSPEFVAVGVPIVAEHLDRAGRAIHLDGRAAILLHGETARHDAKTRITEVENDLSVVFGFDLDLAAIDFALGNRNSGHCTDALRWAEQAGETRDAIDTEIEERAAARLVKPVAPPRTGPSVASASGAWFANVPCPDVRRNFLERRTENDERRADQEA